ncbi:MAG: hypothetical protein U1A77_25810 [Pirellulales bacterium]
MATSISVLQVRATSSGLLSAIAARRQDLWFFSLLSFVALISVHDAALLVFNEELISEYEQNPIGSWLIHVSEGSVWLFVGVKLLGTSLVVATLASIYEHFERLGMVVLVPLAFLQAVLLCYLYFG